MRCRGRTFADTVDRFRSCLWKGLNSPREVILLKRHWLFGNLSHEGGMARVFVQKAVNPLVKPPIVLCPEPWVRKNVSWHCHPEVPAFCWVLPEKWEEHFCQQAINGVDTRILAKDGARWLLQAMTIQLSRHWISNRDGIFQWPKEWEDYSHEEEGVREYREGTFRKS
jgi:hypothetical protein